MVTLVATSNLFISSGNSENPRSAGAWKLLRNEKVDKTLVVQLCSGNLIQISCRAHLNFRNCCCDHNGASVQTRNAILRTFRMIAGRLTVLLKNCSSVIETYQKQAFLSISCRIF